MDNITVYVNEVQVEAEKEDLPICNQDVTTDEIDGVPLPTRISNFFDLGRCLPFGRPDSLHLEERNYIRPMFELMEEGDRCAKDESKDPHHHGCCSPSSLSPYRPPFRWRPDLEVCEKCWLRSGTVEGVGGFFCVH